VSKFRVIPGSGIACEISGFTNAINESVIKSSDEEWSTVKFDGLPSPTNSSQGKQVEFKTISQNKVNIIIIQQDLASTRIP
jgi:hypothetical protein